MKITNALFIVTIGLLVIMFSPNYGSKGQANPAMLITGLCIAAIGAFFVIRSLKKNSKNKKSEGE